MPVEHRTEIRNVPLDNQAGTFQGREARRHVGAINVQGRIRCEVTEQAQHVGREPAHRIDIRAVIEPAQEHDAGSRRERRRRGGRRLDHPWQHPDMRVGQRLQDQVSFDRAADERQVRSRDHRKLPRADRQRLLLTGMGDLRLALQAEMMQVGWVEQDGRLRGIPAQGGQTRLGHREAMHVDEVEYSPVIA